MSISVLGALFLLTGCALTRTAVRVDFKPTALNPLAQGSAAKLCVGEVTDARPVTDKFVLCQKYNGYGERMSGAYVAQEPIADIFKRGLLSCLQTNGFIVASNDARFVLDANLQDFDHDLIGGMWKTTVKPKLTVRFELIEKASGVSVWHDTFTGRDTMETAWGGEQFLVETFNRAADDAIRQLISDKGFRSYFVEKPR